MISNSLYNVRQIKDLKDMIEQSEKLFGSKNAFLIKNKDGTYKGITYSKFKSDMEAFGSALLGLGLKGKFIAVIGENRYEWCLAYTSIVNGAGIVVPLDKELPISEIENLLLRSNAVAVVFSGKFSSEMKGISRSCKSIKHFINMDIEHDEGEFLSFRGLIDKGRELINGGDRSYQNTVIDAEGMSILLFTSGTTDLAKGVMLSHKNICSNITSVCSTVKIHSEDSSLSILPLHHTYECTLGFLALIYSGATISFNEGLKHIAKNLKEVRPTVLIAVPLILENVYRKVWEQAGKKRFMKIKLKLALFVSNILYTVFKLDIRKKLFKQIHENIGGNVRLIITGAAAIDPCVAKWFRWIGIKVLQGYGLTECSPLVTGNRDDAFIDSSAGLPIPGVNVRIDNPNENSIGEVVVKGDNVMLGYFDNETATQKSIKDSWFYTGDLGYFNKAGFLFLTGRSKNVIIAKNGKNVFPEEVESYINRSPYVKESLVCGVHDDISGEISINAQIFPNLDAITEKLKTISITKEDLMNVIGSVIKSVNKDMPIYKRIRHFSIRDNEFIKTTTNKIKRHSVKMI